MSRGIKALGLAFLFWGFGLGLYTTQWPVFLLQRLGSAQGVGWANALITASAFVSYFVGAVLGNVFPKKYLFIVSWAFSSLAPMLWAFGTKPGIIYMGCLIFGFISSFSSPLINAYFLEELEGDFVKGAMYTASMFNVGMVVGPFVGGVIKDMGGFKWLMLAVALTFVLSTVPLLWLRLDRPKPKRLTLPSSVPYYRALAWAFFMAFALLMTAPFGPLYVQQRFSVSGTFLGTLGTISAAGAVLFSYLALRIRVRSRVLSMAVWSFCIGTLMLYGKLWAVFPAFFFRGVIMNTYSLITSTVSHRVPPEASYLGFAMITATLAAANTVASGVGGYAYKSNPQVFFVLSLALSIMGLFAYQTMARGR